MTDLIGDEEELNLLRRENQALSEQASVLEETIGEMYQKSSHFMGLDSTAPTADPMKAI